MSACALCRRRGYATVTSAPLPELRTRIAAGALLSRAPLQLSPLSNFEKSYYAYSKRVRKALADDFEPEWYFRKGSQAERLFLDREDALDANQIEDGPDAANDKDGDLSSLNRRYDRTLYLLLRKKREQGAWQFPQGTVEESDASLKDAAMRELHEEVGPNLDLFAPGKVPASVYTYRLPESSPHSKQYDQTKLFLIPFRILRGQAKLTDLAAKEQIAEFAWLTREEVRERVDKRYWAEALQDGQLLAH